MEYENFLINEANEGVDLWCSQCERTAENCVCEELSDHFREVCSGDPEPDVRVPAGSGTHQTLTEGSVNGRGEICHSSLGASGSGVSTRRHPEIGFDSRPSESFSKWLEAHGDSLPLPQSFSAWLEQQNDTI